MITYNFELNCRVNREGRYAILLRITEDRKLKRIKTNIELKHKSDWNQKKQEVRKSEPEYKKLNDVLEFIKNDAKEKYNTLMKVEKPSSAKDVILALKVGNKSFSFIDFVEDYLKRTFEAGQYRTSVRYSTFLLKLKYFINGVKPEEVVNIPNVGKKHDEYVSKLKTDLLFSDITLQFLLKFESWLKRVRNYKNPELTLHQNSISKLFDNFRSLYHAGRIELKGEGLNLKENPFDDFKCGTIKTSKEKLTEDEIKVLRALELEEGSLLWHTRNCFMLAFFCAGIRAGDLIQLRGTDIQMEDGCWRLHYKMDKTSTEKNLLLIPESIEILKRYVDFSNLTSDYIFPLLDSKAPYAKAKSEDEKERLPFDLKKMLLNQTNSKNSLLNKYLNKLAGMAGITKKLSMHIARHSFANIARQKKANVYDISKALGHSSIKITETYLSAFDTKSEDETMLKVYNTKDDVEINLLAQLQKLNSDELASLLQKLQK